MASIYREGKGWSARVRMNGQGAFKGGFALQKDAKDWARDQETAFSEKIMPKGMGLATPLAVALRNYAYECVAMQKGCKTAVTRINAYLESVGMALLKAEAAPREDGKDIPVLFTLTEQPVSARRLPRTFEAYRTDRLEKRPLTAAQRKKLAAMRVGDIAAHDIDALKKAMINDRFSSSSINNELSILSPFFVHASTIWNWSPLANPCVAVKYSEVNNGRNRVLSEVEQVALAKALATCDNLYIAPFVWFAIETAMRKGEILAGAKWGDVDWENRLVHLNDAKGGKRDVPLTRAAVALLEQLPSRPEGGHIFPITPNALYSGWKRACERAGITNLRIHDLRHTSATRHAKRLSGNIFLLQLITGHKTLSMLKRYVNPIVADALIALDATEPPAAGALAPTLQEPTVPPRVRSAPGNANGGVADDEPLPANVLRVDFARRSAA